MLRVKFALHLSGTTELFLFNDFLDSNDHFCFVDTIFHWNLKNYFIKIILCHLDMG